MNKRKTTAYSCWLCVKTWGLNLKKSIIDANYVQQCGRIEERNQQHIWKYILQKEICNYMLISHIHIPHSSWTWYHWTEPTSPSISSSHTDLTRYDTASSSESNWARSGGRDLSGHLSNHPFNLSLSSSSETNSSFFPGSRITYVSDCMYPRLLLPAAHNWFNFFKVRKRWKT